MSGGVGIEGLQEAQQANLRSIAAVQPTGALAQTIRAITVAAHRYAVSITHVNSGALRASHRIAISGLRGEIYIDPSANSPKGGRAAIYGAVENARGGEHAFYERTESEYGTRAVMSSLPILAKEIQ